MEHSTDFASARISDKILPDKAHLIRNCPEFVKTGFPSLDKLLGGGLTPNLIVLGAISSLGKSTFILQMAQNIAPHRPVLYFSLEMAAYRLAEKSVIRRLYLSARAGGRPAPDPQLLTSAGKLSRLEGEEWNNLASAISAFREDTQELYIIDQDSDPEPFTVQKIERYVQRFYDEMHVMPVVVVDYLQLLRSGEVNYAGTERQLVDHNIAALWRLAHFKGNGTPVIVISSINRESYAKELSFSAFKESGGIEFSADIVLGMQYRNVGKKEFDIREAVQKTPRELELVLLKNRYGPGGVSCQLDFLPAYSHFAEAEENETLGSAPPSAPSAPAKAARPRRSSRKSAIPEDILKNM